MSVYKSLNNMDCMFILLPINVHFRYLIVLRYYNQLPITVRQCPVLLCPVLQCSSVNVRSSIVQSVNVQSFNVQSCNVHPRFFTRPSMSSPDVHPCELVRHCPVLQCPTPFFYSSVNVQSCNFSQPNGP